jgi:hypothetical protein
MKKKKSRMMLFFDDLGEVKRHSESQPIFHPIAVDRRKVAMGIEGPFAPVLDQFQWFVHRLFSNTPQSTVGQNPSNVYNNTQREFINL